MDEFRKELESLINKHSIDNELNVPDFILAEYVTFNLNSLRKLTEQRNGWVTGLEYKPCACLQWTGDGTKPCPLCGRLV